MRKKIISEAKHGDSVARVVIDPYGVTLEFVKGMDSNMVAFSASDDTLRAIANAINGYLEGE